MGHTFLPHGPDGLIDLRSDAVARPTTDMWEAMRTDRLEWSRGGGRTVAELEGRVAALAGMSAGLFVPSGTMANTLALCVAGRPGDVFVVDHTAHVIRAEGHAYDGLAHQVPCPVIGPGGHPTAGQVSSVLASEGAPSLLWLENTHTFAGGTIAPPDDHQVLIEVAARRGIRVHLDGARLWNAAVASGRSLDALVSGVDSVTLNLDKGLGCPAGSVLCGSVAFIESARHWMTALGGVLAQPGMLAACGLVALEDFESVLARDHLLASRLADGLRQEGFVVDEPETNLVLVNVADSGHALEALGRLGVLAFPRDATTIRFVTHRDITQDDVNRVVAAAGCLHAA